RSALRAVAFQRFRLVTRHESPRRIHHAMPRHAAAVPRHYRAHLTRSAETEVFGDGPVRHDAARWDALDGAQYPPGVFVAVHRSPFGGHHVESEMFGCRRWRTMGRWSMTSGGPTSWRRPASW